MKINKRDWLNPLGHDDTGSISYEVIGDEYGVSSSLTIRDCGRQITLDFGCCTEEQYRQRLDKVALVKDYLTQLHQDLKTSYKEFKTKK